MRPVVLAALSLLGGCVFYEPEPAPDGCGSAEDRCVVDDPSVGCEMCLGGFAVCNEETGEWEETACDYPDPLDIEGVLELHQIITVAYGDCEPGTPREPLVLTVVPGAPKSLTADPPIEIVEAGFHEGFSDAEIVVVLLDDWGDGIQRRVEYTLYATDDGSLTGDAYTRHGDSCNEDMTIVGEWGAP